MESSAPRYEPPLIDTAPSTSSDYAQSVTKSEKPAVKAPEIQDYWVFDNGICG